MNDNDPWHELLDPPSDGLPRLVASVQRRRPRVPRPVLVAAASLAACALIAITAIMHRADSQHRFDRALRAALAVDDSVRVVDGAALELPSARPDVRVFVVARTEKRADHD
ncbi:MAG TPA: hypothetical protein VF132_08415 [Rudaea sp.]